MVGVLILVDEDVAELLLVVSTHLLVLLQKADGVEDDVVKVQRPGLPQPLFVGGIEPGDLLHAEVPAFAALPLEVGGELELVLGLGDDAQHRPGRELLVVDALGLEAVLHHADGVVGVVDGEGGREAQLFNVPPEDAHAGGVEGGGPHVPGGGAQHPLQPLLELAGGLVGEGDGDDAPGGCRLQGAQPVGPEAALRRGAGGVVLQKGKVVGRDESGHLRRVRAPAVAHEVGHPMDEHGGLARAGARQQQQRPLGTQHGLLLLGVEISIVEGDGRAPGAAECLLLFLGGQHGISPFHSIGMVLFNIPKAEGKVQRAGRISRFLPAPAFQGRRRRLLSWKLSACISIICSIFEVLFCQPLFFFFVFRNVYSFNLKNHRTCSIIAAGYHHPIVICPLAHNRAALQRRINISADSIPCLSAEFAVHQAVKVILLRRSFQEEGVSRFEARTRT